MFFQPPPSQNVFFCIHRVYQLHKKDIAVWNPIEDAWNCSRGGGNVFSWDQVSAEHRLQLLCLLAPFPTFLRMDPEGGVGLLRGQENVLMGRRKLRGIFWRVESCGEWGVAGKSVRRECWPVNTAPDEPARED